MTKQYRSFEDARKFMQKLKLKNYKEWQKYSKLSRPDDIPSAPNVTYKNKGWISMGDWLGNDRIANNKITSRPFADAKKFVHSLNLKGQNDWAKYRKSGNKPDDIPTNPNRTYKKEWTTWGDWLGTGNVASQNRQYLSFKDAKKFVQKLKLKSGTDWEKYCKSGKPDSIPSTPRSIYKKEWVSMGDWLGTGNKHTKDFLSFEDARKLVHALNLKGSNDWRKYCAAKERSENIPSAPNRIYKNKGWKGWGDWLGTGNKAPQELSKNYPLWPEAKKGYRRLHKEYGLNNYTDWIKFISKHKKLLEKLHLPSQPWFVYTRERVWKRMQE